MTLEVLGRHARARTITRDTVSPGNRPSATPSVCRGSTLQAGELVYANEVEDVLRKVPEQRRQIELDDR